MKYLFLFITLLFTSSLSAQVLTGMGAKWSDAFNEWTVYTDDEEVEGDLTMRWQMRNDWTEWDYRIGESSGSIRMKWKDDPTQWEVRGDGENISIRMKWNNDITEWTLTDGTNRFTFKTRYGNNLNEWLLKNDDKGNFEVYTEYENDPRDWQIVDELDEEISLPMKLGMTFIAVFHSVPK